MKIHWNWFNIWELGEVQWADHRLKAVCHVFLRWNRKRLFNWSALTAKLLPIVPAHNSIIMSFYVYLLLQVRLCTSQEMVHSSWLLRVDSCKLSIQQCHCTRLVSCYWSFIRANLPSIWKLHFCWLLPHHEFGNGVR